MGANKGETRLMRFSLKSLIVTVAVVGLILSLYIVYHRLGAATRELRVLRNELGHLNVTDEQAISFISVPQHEDLKWRWRIRLPKNRKYLLCFKTTGITDDLLSGSTCAFFVDGGEEFSLTVNCHRDQRGEWNITAMTSKGHSQGLGFLGPTHRMWMEGEATCGFTISGRQETVSVQPSGPAQLLRLRIRHGGVETGDGVLVWIVEAPGNLDVRP
jgi:hypothetical protein